MPKSGRSSSAKRLTHGVPAKPTARGKTRAPEPPQPTLDRDALDALAWIESGMPDDKVGYGPDAPRLTPEQLEEFESASYELEAPPASKPVPAAPKRAARGR